jgi:hypothetical protein
MAGERNVIIGKNALEKSFNSNYDALLGSAPASVAPPVAIVPYYLYAVVEKFPVQGMPGHRNAP